MIDSINFHGNWSTAGHRYTEVDVKLLKNEKAQNRLCDQFGKCEYNFDIHFYKGPKSLNNYLEGDQSPEWVKTVYGLEIEPSDDKLTLLITSNVGPPKYPLTPWIIAHRISHALWRNHSFKHYWPIMQAFDSILGRYEFSGNSKWFGCAIGTMRSCRNRTLARNSEIFHELFAQLMLTGRIELNHIENHVLVRNRGRNSEYKHFTDSQVDSLNSIINRMENSVYMLKDYLDSMYGSVIVV